MQIVHGSFLIVLPCRAAEAGSPVVGRCLRVFALTPDIVIAKGVIPGFPAFHKPFMFIRSMVYHQIHHDADSPFMGRCQHFVEIFHRAEFGHDRLIIADVITVIVIGRLIDRGQPDHVDAQIFQIIQPACDSLQVADTVPVAVHKAAGVDLINDRFFPPCFLHRYLHSEASRTLPLSIKLVSFY